MSTHITHMLAEQIEIRDGVCMAHSERLMHHPKQVHYRYAHHLSLASTPYRHTRHDEACHMSGVSHCMA